MKNIIEIEHLSKYFGQIRAVDDISFTVAEGALFAFLGINGAGKSTTISILCGQMKKDAGKIYVDGVDLDIAPDEIKGQLGVVFQHSVLDRALSVRDNLRCRASLYGIMGEAFEVRLMELARLLDFEELLPRTVGKLSGGQRRRIDIARALLHKPRILILDEPTTGLDPQTRRLLWQVIERMRKEMGMTVFLTTHYMEEAADADRVVILDSGRIVACGSPLELKNSYAGDFISLYGISEQEAATLALPYEKVQDGYRFSVPHTQAATDLILKHPSIFRDYEITKGKMDDVFLAATGKKLSGGEEE